MKNAAALTTTNDYKSRLFIMLFHDRERLLELYNAVSRKTTYNPNMPLRFLFYLSDLYSAMTQGKNVYGSKVIPLPTPTFLVFYNGKKKEPDEKELRLSDSYERKDRTPSLELVVRMLNINAGHNEELMHSCRTLREYAEYVHRIREYAKENTVEAAVEQAITECISEDILREFLSNSRAEVKAVSIYEYNEAEQMRMEWEDGYQAGQEELQAILLQERQKRKQEQQRAEQAEAENAKLKQEIARLKNQ